MNPANSDDTVATEFETIIARAKLAYFMKRIKPKIRLALSAQITESEAKDIRAPKRILGHS